MTATDHIHGGSAVMADEPVDACRQLADDALRAAFASVPQGLHDHAVLPMHPDAA